MESEKTQLSDGSNLPLVSIVAVCYNHGPYVEEAINSLLSQNYPRLEIIISDDCSTDLSASIIRSVIEKYDGPHQIVLNVNEKNYGIGGNVAKAQALAKGELIVSADCDDISVSHRVSALVKAWLEQNKKPLLITSDAFDTLESGSVLEIKHCDDLQNIASLADWQKRKPLFFGCTNMYSRQLVDHFPPIKDGCGATDQIMLLRALLMGTAYSLHTPLVYHRRGGITGNKPRSLEEKIKRWLKDTPKAIADMEQQITDSGLCGKGTVLEKHYQGKLSEARLMQSIFEPQNGDRQLIKIIQAKHVPLFKKIRYLGYVYLPKFLSRIYQLKA